MGYRTLGGKKASFHSSGLGRALGYPHKCIFPLLFQTAKKLPKNEPQNAAGAPSRNRGVDLQENNPASRSQCCSN